MTEQLPRRYQAIGTLEGVLVLAKANSTLTVSGSTFPAFVAGKAVSHVKSGEQQFFRVYPDFTNDKNLMGDGRVFLSILVDELMSSA